MARGIVIAGSGDFGIEIAAWIAQACAVQYELRGFIDDRLPDVSEKRDERFPPILSTIRGYRPKHNEDVIVSIAKPSTREKVVGILSELGATFATIIHPSAIIAQDAVIGRGSIICPHSVVSGQVSIGNHVIVNVRCHIGWSAKILDFTTLSSQICVGIRARISECVMVGSSAIVLTECDVGVGSTIAAKAVASGNIPPKQLVFGVPGKAV